MSRGVLIILNLVLLAALVVAVLLCRKHDSPPVVPPPPRSVAQKIEVNILDFHGATNPAVEAWTQQGKLAGMSAEVRRIDATQTAARREFFSQPCLGILVIAGHWRWNEAAKLHYIVIGDTALGVSFGQGDGRQMLAWDRAADERPSAHERNPVHIQFSEDVRAVIFTGAALDDSARNAKLIEFFGDHTPLLGWRAEVGADIHRRILTSPSGFFARFTLNRQEALPARPSIASEWLRAVDTVMASSPDVRAAAIAISLISPQKGPVERGFPVVTQGDAFSPRITHYHRPSAN